ncbi:hypothetical protein ALO94_200977 [Pseudomonas syringae pv. spinaceae]|uniref:SAM-dependent methyltransferase n=1 Tax=Pseudomonas syringae pv. spinaceae TaxID=264459 RepID=A0A0Q0DG48_PSESX|nr:hypothetical protein ALO94_200977 [Pseudomonas syringae pv. spinaceae]
MTKPGVFGSQNEVTHQCQFTATAQRETGHGRDHRFTPRGHSVTFTKQVIEVDLRVRELDHFLDVSPRSEGFLRAGQHDTANGAVRLELVKRVVQLVDQTGIQCVQGLGTVQSDQPDAAYNLTEDCLVIH